MKISIESLMETTISTLLPSLPNVGILDYCQRLSGEVWTGYVDDKLICCWGLVPPTVFSNTAYLWMHHNGSAEHQFVFVRRSQIEVRKMLERYPIIIGHCEIGNVKAIRWMRWLGAVFSEPNHGLLPFVIRRRTDG